MVTNPAGITFDPHKAHVTEKGRFICPHCGNNDAIVESIRVRVSGRYELGIGEVLRLSETGGVYVADVVFDGRTGRRLETLPIQRLEKAMSPWDKLRTGQFDNPKDFLVRQLAWQFALGNTGGELTSSRVVRSRRRSVFPSKPSCLAFPRESAHSSNEWGRTVGCRT